MRFGGSLPQLRLRKRVEVWVPTLPGWCLIGTVAILLFWMAVRSAHPFLALTSRVDAQLLVIEGWVPDFALEDLRAEFGRGNYQRLVITGGPIEKGEPLLEYRTWPDLTKAVMLKRGWDLQHVVSLPSKAVKRDRTYTSALALREWISRTGMDVRGINIYSLGPHARRTRLLFRAALGSEKEIGVISGEDESYDSKKWWTTSQGVRKVLDEAIAYLYARFLFRPDPGGS
jgi:hypothetical protein